MISHLRVVAVAATLWAALPLPLLSQSGALGLCEVSTSNAGEACAGQAAIASDASTSYFNPAGMTRLNGRQMEFGAQILRMSMELRPEAAGLTRNAGSTNLVPGAIRNVPMFL